MEVLHASSSPLTDSSVMHAEPPYFWSGLRVVGKTLAWDYDVCMLLLPLCSLQEVRFNADFACRRRQLSV
jgi:hypothetical protein